MKAKILRIILTWICVYPIVTLIAFTLSSLDFELPMWQNTFVISITLVPIMVLIIGPKVGVAINRLTR